MVRRDLFTRIAGGVGALALGSELWGKTKRHPASAVRSDKRNRISISTWSLHNYFRATRESSFNLPGPALVLLDFPDMIVDRYRIRHF